MDIVLRRIGATAANPGTTTTLFSGSIALASFGLRPDIGGSLGVGYTVVFTHEATSLPPRVRFVRVPAGGVVGAPTTLATTTGCVTAKISAYPGSATYRINRVEELGRLPEVLVFIEERKAGGKVTGYDVWWEVDTVLVAAKFAKWNKAKDSQYGRGRLWTIVNGPVHRPLRW